MQCKFTELTDYQWQVIENYFKGYQPRKHCLRNMLNAILWLTRTGSQWGNMESRYPKWQSVYYYFREWKRKGTLDLVLKKLVEKERLSKGKMQILVSLPLIAKAPKLWLSRVKKRALMAARK